MKQRYMKVGTWPGMMYWVKGNNELEIKTYIRFKEIKSGAKWEGGIVSFIKDGVPFIERM